MDWLKELCRLSSSNHTEQEDGNTINLIIEIARTLLYSNIPEQVVDLYSLYQEILTRKRQRDYEMPVIPTHTKLLSLTTRALIRLDDVPSALKLLKAAARVGLEFDIDAKSTLIADLAVCSPSGLQAALLMRRSMKDKLQALSTVAATSVVKVAHLTYASFTV